jgi:hypothetical protein
VPGVTSPQETRNPTFEIYSPPYLFRGARPKILGAPTAIVPGRDQFMEIGLDGNADQIESVMLMRRTAITHLIDGGQRGVELPITRRQGNTVQVRVPGDASVLPAGPYLLFVNKKTSAGPTPSVAWDVKVQQGTVPTPTAIGASSRTDSTPAAADLKRAGAVPVAAELAYHEIAEVSGHHHALPGKRDDGDTVPWSTLPALAGILTTGFWTLNRRKAGQASRTGIVA